MLTSATLERGGTLGGRYVRHAPRCGMAAGRRVLGAGLAAGRGDAGPAGQPRGVRTRGAQRARTLSEQGFAGQLQVLEERVVNDVCGFRPVGGGGGEHVLNHHVLSRIFLGKQ